VRGLGSVLGALSRGLAVARAAAPLGAAGRRGPVLRAVQVTGDTVSWRMRGIFISWLRLAWRCVPTVASGLGVHHP